MYESLPKDKGESQEIRFLLWIVYNNSIVLSPIDRLEELDFYSGTQRKGGRTEGGGSALVTFCSMTVSRLLQASSEGS